MPNPRTSDLLNSYTITEAPSSLQTRTDYNADGTISYIGSAIRGAAASDRIWTLFQYTYNASQAQTLKQTAFDSWDNRATAEYA